MKFSNIRQLILGAIALMTGTLAQAQIQEAGFTVGIANYKGELAPVINYLQPGPNVSAFYRYNFSPAWSVRANLSFGQIKADDAKSNDDFARARNHSFKTNIWELSGQFEYNFLNFRGGGRKQHEVWTPYVFAGLGLTYFDPIKNIQPTYRTTTVCIPLGVGMKGQLSENWNIGLDFGARFTFTDVLDDVGIDLNGSYPRGFFNPKYYTGNTADKDMYFFTSISFSYVLRSLKKDCPIQVGF